MSSKNKRISPRAMPVETIVTRFKSAQLKQNVREKPAKEIQRKTKKPKSPVKPKVSKPIEVIDDNSEFYPNKLKRKISVKKIVLLPKHDYKVVAARCNKRKLNIPKKEVKHTFNASTDTDSPKYQKEQSISEMIKLIEDSGNLDDDDLMEILTCPSPVWWEDPPDGYVEDPISQLNSETDCKIESRKENTTEAPCIEESSNSCKNLENQGPLLDINIKINDPKFIKKRGKLENLLGNLKKGKINEIVQKSVSDKSLKTDLNTSMDEDTILSTLENMEIPIDNKLNCDTSEDKLTVKNEKESKNLEKQIDTNLDRNKAVNKLNSLKDLKVNVLKEASISALKYLESDTSDFVTVYKIINNDVKKEERNRQMHSYYKNCKYVKRKADKKCIVVSEKETVKYCLKCSAIFDTEDCVYCMKKIKSGG